MSAASTSQQSSTTEYVVRVPKSTRKKYHMMRFNKELGQDFFRSWSHCKIEKENNIKVYNVEETPKFGAGSEFGRELREEARRKRFGINVRKYKSEDQPWMLSVGAKNNKKKFKGIREGGISDHTGWYVFMQGKDGAFEAYPVEEWYNFQPVMRYKALSAEEAEIEFEKRDTIMNYFQVMLEKKLTKDDYPDEDEGKKKSSAQKKLMLSEIDDWVDDDEEDEDHMDSDDDQPKKKKPKKKAAKRKSNKGGKKKVNLDGNSGDDSCIEESDEYDEAAEHDYISGDSSDSDQENEEKVSKDLTGVEEAEALRKLLDSDEDDEADKDSEKSDVEAVSPEKSAKKKKQNIPEDSSDSSEEDVNLKGKSQQEGETVVSKLKRKVKENPLGMPEAKRMKLGTGTASATNLVTSDSPVSDESIRRYLMRKPMTATELLQKFKSKKSGLSSEQLVQQIALVLKKVNPAKQLIKGRMHFYIKIKP